MQWVAMKWGRSPTSNNQNLLPQGKLHLHLCKLHIQFVAILTRTNLMLIFALRSSISRHYQFCSISRLRGGQIQLDILWGVRGNCCWGADHTSQFWHCPLTSPTVIVCKVVDQHPCLNIIFNNFTIGTGRKVWCDRGMSKGAICRSLQSSICVSSLGFIFLSFLVRHVFSNSPIRCGFVLIIDILVCLAVLAFIEWSFVSLGFPVSFCAFFVVALAILFLIPTPSLVII